MPRLSDLPVPTYAVCSVQIAALDAAEATERIVADARAGASCQVHLCNAYTLSLVDSDPQMLAALQAADLNLADGVPVAWLGRKRGMKGPIRGADLVGRVMTLGGSELRHFLYGGKPGVAEEMTTRLSETVPGLTVVGTESPPFTEITPELLAGLAERVRASGAQVLWIGLGTPRQDYFVHTLAESLSMPIVPVGAAFDFWAGSVKQAPRILQGSGWSGCTAWRPSRDACGGATCSATRASCCPPGATGGRRARPRRPQPVPVDQPQRGEPARAGRGRAAP